MTVEVLGTAVSGIGDRDLMSTWSIAIPVLMTYVAGLRVGLLLGSSLVVAALALFGLEHAGISPHPPAPPHVAGRT